ncbi:unnamed protein product [Polarella glacialis]|uniref:NADP-dependent oxidoreductase domain-containing protein n=1 Tax=Polarella glacialis TaxID=89957 RepID=A0A813K853_POLGL|nr:unnamed protein product [Polarella glacialis]
MADSRVPRGEICLVTKLSNPGEYRSARQRFEQQLQTLGVDYIDVYMLHSPGSSMEERQAAWRQMEELYDEGRIKALGVSNFDIPLLQELLGFARVRPVYLQNKYSIYEPGGHGEVSQPDSLMEWLAKEGIVMTGYSFLLSAPMVMFYVLKILCLFTVCCYIFHPWRTSNHVPTHENKAKHS